MLIILVSDEGSCTEVHSIISVMFIPLGFCPPTRHFKFQLTIQVLDLLIFCKLVANSKDNHRKEKSPRCQREQGRWSATVGRAGMFPEKALVVAGVPSKETLSGASQDRDSML